MASVVNVKGKISKLEVVDFGWKTLKFKENESGKNYTIYLNSPTKDFEKCRSAYNNEEDVSFKLVPRTKRTYFGSLV